MLREDDSCCPHNPQSNVLASFQVLILGQWAHFSAWAFSCSLPRYLSQSPSYLGPSGVSTPTPSSSCPSRWGMRTEWCSMLHVCALLGMPKEMDLGTGSWSLVGSWKALPKLICMTAAQGKPRDGLSGSTWGRTWMPRQPQK